MTSYTARPEEGEIMHCLHEWRSGSLEAENELFRLAFPNLCCLASYILKGERCTHGLEPRDLVNQVISGWRPPRIETGRIVGIFLQSPREPCADMLSIVQGSDARFNPSRWSTQQKYLLTIPLIWTC